MHKLPSPSKLVSALTWLHTVLPWLVTKLQLLQMMQWGMQALGAEIIVTFEGTSENGAQFMSRQSYLSSEIHWGYVFVDIVHHAQQGETTHTVDIARQVMLCALHNKLCKVKLCRVPAKTFILQLPVICSTVCNAFNYQVCMAVLQSAHSYVATAQTWGIAYTHK